MISTVIPGVPSLNAILKDPSRTYHDFAIALSHGAFSRKEMALNEDGTYFILNDIDGTTQNLTAEELFDESLTNIGKAIEAGAFYHLNYDETN